MTKAATEKKHPEWAEKLLPEGLLDYEAILQAVTKFRRAVDEFNEHKKQCDDKDFMDNLTQNEKDIMLAISHSLEAICKKCNADLDWEKHQIITNDPKFKKQ